MSWVFITLHVRFYFPDITTFCDLLYLTLIREWVELSTNINQGSVYYKGWIIQKTIPQQLEEGIWMHEKIEDAIGLIVALNQRRIDNIMEPHPYNNPYFSH